MRGSPGRRRGTPPGPQASRTSPPDFSLQGRTEPRDTLLGELSYEDLKPLVAEGVARGYAYVFELAVVEDPPPVTLELIQELHRRSFGAIYSWAGKWRAIDLDWPPPEVVSRPWSIVMDVRNMCDDLEYRLNRLPAPDDPGFRSAAIETLAWFQHRFVKVHPFRDFNGRTARMLTSYVLLQLGFPALEFDANDGEGRARYVAAMRAADALDLGPLTRIVADALDEATTDA